MIGYDKDTHTLVKRQHNGCCPSTPVLYSGCWSSASEVSKPISSSTSSALEFFRFFRAIQIVTSLHFMTMRYINRLFTYLFTFWVAIQLRCNVDRPICTRSDHCPAFRGQPSFPFFPPSPFSFPYLPFFILSFPSSHSRPFPFLSPALT